jgi:hypothetical protein
VCTRRWQWGEAPDEIVSPGYDNDEVRLVVPNGDGILDLAVRTARKECSR